MMEAKTGKLSTRLFIALHPDTSLQESVKHALPIKSIRNLSNTANPSTHIRLDLDMEVIRKIHISLANHADIVLVVSYKK